MYDPTWYTVVEEQIAVNISFGLFPGNKEFAWAQHFETQSSRSWNWKQINGLSKWNKHFFQYVWELIQIINMFHQVTLSKDSSPFYFCHSRTVGLLVSCLV